MRSIYQNDQHYLAEQFMLLDSLIEKECKMAMETIQCWKQAITPPVVGKIYLRNIKDILQESFFFYVPYAFVLRTEEYYFANFAN